MLLLIFFAFLSGLATILAPCIWPLLPILLSASVTGSSKLRPLGISLGIVISFAFFTLTISYLVSLFHFDPNIFRVVATVVIAFLGLSLIIPPLSLLLDSLIGRLSGLFNFSAGGGKSSFLGGLALGLSLGIIWSPCAGPILATIALLSATRMVNLQAVILTLSYTLGVGIPLLLFTLFGSLLFQKSKFLAPRLGKIQRFFGLIMIITAILIYTGYDQILQTKLLNLFPNLDISSKIEQNPQVSSQLDLLKGTIKSQKTSLGNSLLTNYGPAPDFVGITNWLNTSQPLTMQGLKGKVVLVDFWTYTCINCLRTLPFVTSWYEKYKNQGFIVIGVHTPEFEFEKQTSNVEGAIKQYNIRYPVAQDNNYQTWNNFSNQYWPAEYLIDSSGNVRRTHFGEGEYDQTEMAIQQLLQEKGSSVSGNLTQLPDQTPQNTLTPETYLGLKRLENIATNPIPQGGVQTFNKQTPLPKNYFSFLGTWDIEQEFAQPTKGASLEFNFTADKVFLVITPQTPNEDIKVYLDNQIVPTSYAGQDVKNGQVILDQPRLYNLIDLKNQPGTRTLRLEFNSNNLKLFAFTFG